MGFSFFAAGRNARLVVDLAMEIAARSRTQVSAQVIERARKLPSNEARGYTRAHVRALVAVEARKSLAAHVSLDKQVRERIFVAALDQVVNFVMRDLMSLPARAILRRAA